ncbi:MAG: PilZ domain-containing protein [Planctomycetota bacterium]
MRQREMLEDFTPVEGPKRRLSGDDLGVLNQDPPEPEPLTTEADIDHGRRRHPRVENARQMRAWIAAPGGSLEGPHVARTVDASRGGMRFVIRGRWAKVGVKVVISHELTEGPLYGEIVRVRRGWTQSEVAVRFETMPEELSRAVRRSLADAFVWSH